jgi:hypothetical protein
MSTSVTVFMKFLIFIILLYICIQAISTMSEKGINLITAKKEFNRVSIIAPQKVLFWISFGDYLNRMDRFLYDMIDAGLQMNEIAVTVWGPGWPGWNKTISTNENIIRKFGYGGNSSDEPYFDIAVGASHAEGFHIEDPKQKTVYLFEMGDCHVMKPQSCIDAVPQNAQIISSMYGHELLAMFHPQPPQLTGAQRLFYHISSCANPSLYHPRVSDYSKRRNVRLIGAVWPLYPVRVAAEEAIKKGLINNGKVQNHPGYDVPHNNSDPPEEYNPNSALTISHRKQQSEYATVLGTSRICIFDSSVIRKMIRKFVESAMSGCVIASDMPLEMWVELKPFVIELPHNSTALQIAEIINAAQEDLPDLARRSAEGVKWATSSATCVHKMKTILSAVDAYRAGKRGYYFPHSVALDCYSTLDGVKPSWC